MKSEIGSIAKATGLGDERRETVEALLDVFNRVNAPGGRNAERRDYYEGDIAIKDIGVDAVPDDIRIHTSCDWPAKAVDSVAERVRLTGFSFEDDARDEAFERVVAENRLLSAFSSNLPSELVHGCMAATVGRHNGRTQVRFHAAETCAMEWDSAAARMGAGFVIAGWARTEWSKRVPVPVQVNLHLPGEVTVLTRTSRNRWSAETSPTPLDRPMMEAFVFKGTGDKPFGRSRITRNVIDIADEVLRIKEYMAFSGAISAAPQKWLMGLTDEQFEKLKTSKWSTYIGSWVFGTADEDGNSPKIGQLPAASPLPYIEMLRQQAAEFSGATGVPMGSLGVEHDNPASAEAIQASREDIISVADDLIASSRDSLREVALMAMAAEDGKSIDELPAWKRTVEASFRSPLRHSRAENADAALKLAQAIPGFAESRVFLEMQDFDQSEIRRIQSDVRRIKAEGRTDSLLEAIGAMDERPEDVG